MEIFQNVTIITLLVSIGVPLVTVEEIRISLWKKIVVNRVAFVTLPKTLHVQFQHRLLYFPLLFKKRERLFKF